MLFLFDLFESEGFNLVTPDKLMGEFGAIITFADSGYEVIGWAPGKRGDKISMNCGIWKGRIPGLYPSSLYFGYEVLNHHIKKLAKGPIC